MFKKGLFLVIAIGFIACKKHTPPPQIEVEETAPLPPIVKEFDFVLNDYHVVKDTIKSGDSFGAIMDAHGVNRSQVFEISNKVKDSFNVARIAVGKPYTILKSKDSMAQVKAFIYQKSKVSYTVVHVDDSIYALNKKKKVVTKRRSMTGVIESSLSQTIENENVSPYLTHMLSGIYQWSIDFFKIQKGDRFKVIFTEQYLEDGTYVGINDIEASIFEHNNTPFYAFQYEVKESEKKETSYYDDQAKSLQSFFLKAPLQFSRISSRYSRRRFHPVQKRWKSHKGTDYAAPHGTPIWSTANGTVIKAGYTSGNGKYVKVKHNNKYSTQYLHMSKILVKKGQYVKQGDVIGRVGSTGLATGPHVCYRFWVNGRQVDPYRQKLPSAKNIEEKHKEAYFEFIKPIKIALDSIPFKSANNNQTYEDITISESNSNNCLESLTGAL
ncbi:M23 family metallopeptidase [Aquimarina agarilytica]|uniref:M23 family metallopeptidase n=1 Tax=Aquimarina agarilytica TaxID=1087449 RepID=UPI00028989FD|nr:M23 family metallopeptidase [Aquimarina agarilytica]